MEKVRYETNRYKVLDVREEIGDSKKPIVLICQEFGGFARRRIEVYNYNWDPGWQKSYKTAQIIVPGDVILVHESYNKNGCGGHVIEDIEV